MFAWGQPYWRSSRIEETVHRGSPTALGAPASRRLLPAWRYGHGWDWIPLLTYLPQVQGIHHQNAWRILHLLIKGPGKRDIYIYCMMMGYIFPQSNSFKGGKLNEQGGNFSHSTLPDSPRDPGLPWKFWA